MWHGKLPEMQPVQHPNFSEQSFLPRPPQLQLRGGSQSRGQKPRFCTQELTNHCGNTTHRGPCTLGSLKEHREGQDFPPKHSRLFPLPLVTSKFSFPLPHSKGSKSHHNGYISFLCWFTSSLSDPWPDTVGPVLEHSTCLSACSLHH